MPQSATIDELMARFGALTHGGAPRERKPTPAPPRRAAAAPPPAPAARPNSFQPPALPPPGHPAGDQGSPQAKARKERPPSAPVPLRMLTPADCALAEPRGYTIKGMVAPADVAIVFGQPGAGKSVIAPHLGYAVAQGDPVFGRRVKPGVVFYVAAEDPHGMKGRVHGLRLERGDAPDFRLIEGVRDLLSEDSPDRDALLDLIREHKPRLVIIDTIAAAFPGLQENDAEAMGRVVGYARDITACSATIRMRSATIRMRKCGRGLGTLAGCGKSSKFEGFPEVLRTPPCVRGLILLHPLALTARIGNCSPPSCSHPAGMTACPARAARRAARAVMPCRRPVAITVAAAA